MEVKGTVNEVAHLVPVSGWHAEEGGNDRRRHPGAEVGHVVEPVRADVRIEELGAQGSDLLLEDGDAARGEGLGHQAAQTGVIGRVQENHEPALQGLGLHQLQHGAMGRAEGLGIAMGRIGIDEAAQGIEIVLRVVVDGSLVAQATPDRMGISLVLLVERVSGQGAVGWWSRGHPAAANWGSQGAVATNSSSVMATTCS
jgi:ribosomal protein L30/L7E